MLLAYHDRDRAIGDKNQAINNIYELRTEHTKLKLEYCNMESFSAQKTLECESIKQKIKSIMEKYDIVAR